ncbi:MULTISPECIES: exonuclease domain-containing protein [Cytobacillus]|uniref:exonuclease domain-containing protein n=1 Tax=Cytobacillus TaxID=2675230 RepID=UPI00203DD663|nr:exonuclease domain-containing protein [Cytobacillus firmus]MCM3706598.1 exonuclease domain-containing protein [Cytobacillus firmus]
MRFNPFIQFVRGIQGKLQTSVLGGINGQNPNHVAFIRQMQRELQYADSMSVPLRNLNVAVFDIETTGFYPDKGDQIISIGAVKISSGKISEDSFYSLVQLDKALPGDIKELTGLTEAELEKAPPLPEVFISFLEFVKGMPLVAHHANHEKNFMQYSSWKLFRTPFKHRILDTSFLYRITDHNKVIWKLEDMCEFYNIPVKDRHHALGDAKLTALLWCCLIEKVHNLGCSNLKEVYERLARLK